MAARVTSPHIVYVGAGNIGSAFGPLLARALREFQEGRADVIDLQHYEAANLAGQHILPAQVGRAKAVVAAEAMQAINPDLAVHSHVDTVEQVPLGGLRADLLVSCVDNRAARQVINARAWRANTPWLDTAVDAAASLVRLNLYVPGTATACGVCPWSDEEFSAAPGGYSCTGEPIPAATTATTATAAPAELGALVAALACMQVRRVLDGDLSLAGHQLMLDVHHYRQQLARLPVNPDCRLDHAPWRIENLQLAPDRLTLGEAFRLLDTRASVDAAATVTLRHDALSFIRRLRCTGCGASGRPLLRLSGRKPDIPCRRCGAVRVATGFDHDNELTRADVLPHWMDKTLAHIGFRRGDVLSVSQGESIRHFQLGVSHE